MNIQKIIIPIQDGKETVNMSSIKCSCCNDEIGCFDGFEWLDEDKRIGLLEPPEDLRGIRICKNCYIDGPTMEQRIRVNICSKGNKVIMPNGVDGHVCTVCNEFWSYVESNQPNGTYVCVKHRTF